ncbi:hypothetical protein Tco_0902356 [Tanacetum coccineum]
MGDEHLSTIPKKVSDEFIKSSVEDLISIQSESEDTSERDNFTSSDDESLSEEDVPKETFKIYSNPLFEFDDDFTSSDANPLFNEVLEDIECKVSYDSNLDESIFLVTPLSNSNEDECLAPGDDIELLLHHDLSISFVSILEGFIDEPPLKENDDLFDLEPKENDWKKILYDIKVKEFQRSFRHSDTERLSRSDEVLKLKKFKKDATLKLFKSTNQERYEHVGPEVTSSQDGKVYKMAKRLCLVDDLKMLKITMSNTSSRNKLNPEINDHYNILTGECQKDELKTKDKA